MTLRIIHKAKAPKARRAIVYAASKWEPYVYEGFLRALREARKAFRTDEVVAALARNAPEIAVAAMPWPELERALERNLMAPIKNAVADGAAAAVRDLTVTKRDDPKKKKPKPRPTGFSIGADISFDLDNPRTQSYLARNAATLVRRVRDETRLAIRRITTDAHARGLNVGQQAEKIAAALRRDIGLNQRQAGALGKLEASLIESGIPQARIDTQVNAYRDRLIDSRARMIARHETMTGSSVGQQEVWTQATEQGLLEPDQKRRLLTQPRLNPDNPCAICGPAAGEIRGLREPFSIGMGPPFHVGCECTTVLHFDD